MLPPLTLPASLLFVTRTFSTVNPQQENLGDEEVQRSEIRIGL